jgi:murein DD-endopeptidase MepM/ murein hydrolase activator NlpD
MATTITEPQFPVAGRYKKDFKITSPYGYRMHPIRKEKIHHNGVDFWGAKEPLKLEVWFDGVVSVVATNNASFGHYVVIKHKVYGKKVTSLYAHLKAPSKLKKGQRVTAGTVVGIMGATGPVTGKHLHFELGKGTVHPFQFGGNGARYYDPIKFINATIKKWEAEQELVVANAEAVLPTSEDAPVSPVPTHSLSEEDAPKVNAEAKPVAKKAGK